MASQSYTFLVGFPLFTRWHAIVEGHRTRGAVRRSGKPETPVLPVHGSIVCTARHAVGSARSKPVLIARLLDASIKGQARAIAVSESVEYRHRESWFKVAFARRNQRADVLEVLDPLRRHPVAPNFDEIMINGSERL
jgi:hypothetical protein